MGEVKVRNKIKIQKSKVFTNMVLLLLGRIVSLFGTRIYSFAISLYVLKLTESGFQFSLTVLLSTVPRILISPIAGTLTDKVDRKKMIVIMDILSGIAVLGLFAAAYFHELRLPYIYGTTVILSICNTLFDVPMRSSIPNLVDENNLTRINALNKTVTSVSMIAAPALGGIIYALVDMKIFLVINGLSFIFSAITELFINFNLNKKESKKENTKTNNSSMISNLKNDTREAYIFLKGKSAIFMIMIFSVALNFFATLGTGITIMYIMVNVLELSSKQVGILNGVFPIGMILGSLALSILPEAKKHYRKLIVGLLIFDMTALLMGIFAVPKFRVFGSWTYTFIFSALMFIVGIAMVYINVPIEVTMQREVPDEMRGKVFGLDNMLSEIASPVAIILAGILLDLIPAFILPVFTAVILTILTIMMAFNKEIRKF